MTLTNSEAYVELNAILLDAEQGLVPCLPNVNDADEIIDYIENIIENAQDNTQENLNITIKNISKGENLKFGRDILLFSIGFVVMSSKEFDFIQNRISIQRILGCINYHLALYLLIRTLPYSTEEELLCRFDHFRNRIGLLSKQTKVLDILTESRSKLQSCNRIESIKLISDIEMRLIEDNTDSNNGIVLKGDLNRYGGDGYTPQFTNEMAKRIYNAFTEYEFTGYLTRNNKISLQQVESLINYMAKQGKACTMAMLKHINFLEYLNTEKGKKKGKIDEITMQILNVCEREATQYRLCMENKKESTTYTKCDEVRNWLLTIQSEYKKAITYIPENQEVQKSA